MCVLEPTFEGVLTAPEGWFEYTKFKYGEAVENKNFA
jgi:hypothetical protein